MWLPHKEYYPLVLIWHFVVLIWYVSVPPGEYVKLNKHRVFALFHMKIQIHKLSEVIASMEWLLLIINVLIPMDWAAIAARYVQILNALEVRYLLIISSAQQAYQIWVPNLSVLLTLKY